MFRWRLKSSLFARDMKGSRRRKLLKLTLLLPLVASLVVGWFIYREAVKIHGTPLTSWQEDHSGDCAVVLTGGANRVHEGFALLAQKQVRKLIISGVFEGAKLEEIFPLLPFYGTIASKDVVLEKNSRTTFGNAQQSLALVEALKCRDVVLVTSYLHMRRALRTFDATFPVRCAALGLDLERWRESTSTPFWSSRAHTPNYSQICAPGIQIRRPP